MDEAATNHGRERKFRTIGVCELEVSSSCSLVIFGASGDLAKRKLIPSIYRLHKNRLLSENFFILGADRIEMSNEQFLDLMKASVKNVFPEDYNDASWNEFVKKLYYISFDFSVTEFYSTSLKEKLHSLEKKHQTGSDRVFYLAIPPTVFENVINNLGVAGLSREEKGETRVVVEKPFGRDIDSAKKLNNIIEEHFRERQIFRIDHYIAKETVQNMLMFRFANSIFEPLWNRRYIDHVQITVSETLGVEHRAEYYEKTGVIRDMFQSHILQLLAVTAMEPPVAFEADRVRDEKIKVFRSIRPFDLERLDDYIVIGQYGRGEINGNPVIAYREEKGVSPQSTTATFAAMKVFIDNWRWNGVPFYLCSGKRLTTKNTEISIHFNPVPYLMFERVMDEVIKPNILCFRVQPREGISLAFQTKRTGSRICLDPVIMNFDYQKGVQLDAYEWVLLDCMLGDQMLFLRQEGVELTWSLLTPVLEKIESNVEVEKIPIYAAGSSGPEEARRLIERDGLSWRPL